MTRPERDCRDVARGGMRGWAVADDMDAVWRVVHIPGLVVDVEADAHRTRWRGRRERAEIGLAFIDWVAEAIGLRAWLIGGASNHPCRRVVRRPANGEVDMVDRRIAWVGRMRVRCKLDHARRC